MTFDANDAGTGAAGFRRAILSGDQFGEAAPSLAVAAGDGAA